MNVTVYLSSKTGVAQEYSQAVEEVARGIAEAGAQLVYGGSNAGQMHLLAAEAKRAGARVVGIIPEVFRSLADPLADEMIYTRDLAARKNLLFAMADVIVALPGGIGTLDEVMSALAEMTISALCLSTSVDSTTRCSASCNALSSSGWQPPRLCRLSSE